MKRAFLTLLLFVCSFAAPDSKAQQPLFFTPSTLPSYQLPGPCSDCTLGAGFPFSGDFNGDGIVDLAYIGSQNQTGAQQYLVVAFGQSTGVPTQVATSLGACAVGSPYSIATADINRDGKLDVMMVCTQGYSEVFLGNGDGTFQPPQIVVLPAQAAGLVLADFNGDGLPDAAVLSSGGYSILLNTGGGHFGAAQNYPISVAGTAGFAVADFNGDGKKDLFFGGLYALGNGDGTFGAVVKLPFVPSSYAVGDFNEDGFDDVVATSALNPARQNDGSVYLIKGGASGLASQAVPVSYLFNSPNIFGALKLGTSTHLSLAMLTAGPVDSQAAIVLTGNGDGTFLSPVEYAGILQAFADMNADGILDLIESPWLPQTGFAEVAPGNKDGSFQGIPDTDISFDTGPVVVDMNGDGLPDVVASWATEEPQVFLSQGNGFFAAGPQAAAVPGEQYVTTVAAADLNGDGKQDVLATAFPCSSNPCYDTGNIQLLSYLGDGTGTLTYASDRDLGIGTLNATTFVTGVFGKNGDQDAVVMFHTTAVGSTGGGVLYVAGNGDGTFAAPVTLTLLGYNPVAIASADLNGDHKPDFVLADQDGTVASYLGNGDGTFTPLVSSILQQTCSAIVVTDVTGDGNPDLICTTTNTQSNPEIDVFAGNGDGSFASTPVSSMSPGRTTISQITVGDVNGDGLPDIAFAGLLGDAGGEDLIVFLNQGAGVFVQDPTVYVFNQEYASSSNMAVLMQVNRNATPSGGKAYLDALLVSPGLVPLFNVNNPAPQGLPWLGSPTLSLSVNGSTNVTFGQTVTVTATITPAPGYPAPTGTVNFYVNSTKVATSSLSGTQATAQIQIAAVGTVVVEGQYSGDSKDNGATATLNLTSAPESTTVTLTSSATSAAQGVPITFTATVAPDTATGTVTFSDGTTSLGQGSVTAGVATLTTGSLSVGSHSITAAYGGDADNAPSSSSALTISITAPSLQLSANPASLTIVQGSSGSTTITATPVGAYTGSVTFSCSGLPANSSCTFTPASLSFTGSPNETAQTSVLTITTDVATAAQSKPRTRRQSGGVSRVQSLSVLLVSLFMVIRKRRAIRSLNVVLFALVGATLLFVSSCGGGGSGGSKTPVTPVGTSTVVISTSGSGGSLNLSLTVSQ